jgi:hypothetical protein
MITYLMLFRQAIPERKDKSLKIRKLLDNELFPVLLNRTVLFFLTMSLIDLFLYSIGTIQGFTDSTQLFLLRLGAILSILLALSAFYGVVLDLFLFFYRKKIRFICGAWVYALFGLLGGLAAAASGFIISLSGGNV